MRKINTKSPAFWFVLGSLLMLVAILERIAVLILDTAGSVPYQDRTITTVFELIAIVLVVFGVAAFAHGFWLRMKRFG